MNKVHRQRKSHLKKIIFSCNGLLAISNATGRESTRAITHKPPLPLLAAVVLPHFGLSYSVNPYPVPYEWLIDKGALTADDKEGQKKHSEKPVIYHYNQHKTLQLFSTNALSSVLVKKEIQTLPGTPSWSRNSPKTNNVSAYYRPTQVKPNREKAKITHSSKVHSTNHLVFTDSVINHVVNYLMGLPYPKVMMNSDNGSIRGDTEKKPDKQEKSRCAKGLFDTIKTTFSTEDRGEYQRVLPASTANATATKVVDTNMSYRGNPGRSRKIGDQTALNTVLQGESIRRTIKTLAKNVEDRVDIEVIQRQLQEAERINNQGMRRLQQSLDDLKNRLNVQRQSVSFYSSKPPSLYGLMK